MKPSLVIRIAKAILRWESPGSAGRLRSAARRYLRWNRQLLLDPELRYRVALRFLKDLPSASDRKILDVGSGPAGLAYFLKSSVVGVDVAFVSQDFSRYPSLIRPVQASATALPFRDRSFDAVVSMDTIEHLPRADRSGALREMLRVAREGLVVGFPYGPDSARFDARALEEERTRGEPMNWREEHLYHGLPDDETHRGMIELALRLRPDLSIAWFGQEGLVGLRLRWKLQQFVSKDSRLYGLVFVPLYWLHAHGWRRRAYRRVYLLHRRRK